MSHRIVMLALFLVRNLFRTLLGILPPALTLLVYRLTFTYRNQGDPAYFTAVGGLGLALVCVITAILVADRANRAAMYPLVARLPHRIELLAAVALGTVLIMIAMAALYTTMVLGFQHMTLTPMEILLIAPRWLILLVFATTLGMQLSKLVSRNGSHVIAYLALGAMAFGREQLRFLDSAQHSLWIDITERITLPITDTLTAPLEVNPVQVLPALALTLLYAGVLFALAVGLFSRKDLLWAE